MIVKKNQLLNQRYIVKKKILKVLKYIQYIHLESCLNFNSITVIPFQNNTTINRHFGQRLEKSRTRYHSFSLS